MISDHLRAISPSGSSIDDIEAAFATEILQIDELVASPQERILPGRG